MSNYKKAEDISPTMCIMPWIGLATDASGGIRPCCWMQSITDDKFFGDPNDYADSDYLKEKKEQFLKGEYPNACSRCKHDSEKGMQSKRDRENLEWTTKGGDWNKINEQNFTMIDLRLSNTCNLGCVMCGPKSSSFLFNETVKHYDNAPEHNQNQLRGVKHLDLMYPYTDDQIEQIIEIIPKDARIYCTGGEPSLVKKNTKLLEVLLEKGYNKTVKLQFNSNFQTLNQSWFDLLEHFKGDMLPSLDGVGKVAEYIRYPCNWEQVDDNVRKFIEQCGKTWMIKVMPTISSVSIFGLKDMYDWWYNDIRLKYPIVNESISNTKQYKAMRVQVNNRLNSPNFFDIRNLTPLAKEKAHQDIDFIIENYNQYFQIDSELKYLTDIKKQLDLEQQIETEILISNLDKFDNIRNIKWRESLPELAEYIDA